MPNVPGNPRADPLITTWLWMATTMAAISARPRPSAAIPVRLVLVAVTRYST
ncbi:MAG TPA: hypothetical protein VMG38_16460 [Trebonia sp.]|nr:hypothetical protein [Trebonia sp.]